MVVGLLLLDLHVPASRSLKVKRMTLRSILDRLRRHLNVSAAEVDHQDVWQRSLLGIVSVNTSAREAEATLERAVAIVDGVPDVEILSRQLEWR